MKVQLGIALVGGSSADLDGHFPVSLRSTPQSESLGRVLASLPPSSSSYVPSCLLV